MRTNITYYMSSEEKIYIKDGTNIYELKDFPQKEFELCWKSLQNRNHEDIDNNLCAIYLTDSFIESNIPEFTSVQRDFVNKIILMLGGD